MPQPGTIIGSFTDELGELGKQIVKETVKVPKDIAGKALESLGASSGQKPGQSSGAGSRSAGQDQKAGEKGPLDQLGAVKEQQAKQTIARAALAQLAGGAPKQKEPTVWEKIQAEAEQKKELSKQQQQQTAARALPVIKSKRPRGDLYGLKAKKAGAEVGKNVRQD